MSVPSISWLARSLANSLGIDDDGEAREECKEEEDEQLSGVKEDLTEFRDSVTRQFLGVARFLAPPPAPDDSSDPSISGDERASAHNQDGYESDELSESGRLEVEGISRFPGDFRGSFLSDVSYAHSGSKLEERNRIRKAVGATEEVLAFAGNIAHHPETWLDFPIDEDDASDDFDLSESQEEHVEAIERLTPRLRALRIELCPVHMSEGYFWKVYFVLLHSRLNKHDAELLSTPQVAEARTKWMHELRKRAKEELERQCFRKENSHLFDDFSSSPPRTYTSDPPCFSTSCDSETEKQPDPETEFFDKPSARTALSKTMMSTSIDDDEDWPEDDMMKDEKGMTAIPLGFEDEVSFSDLEDDDCNLHIKYNVGSK